jgi:hypothetical protein
MFENNPVARLTADPSRDAVLEVVANAPEQTTEFLLTWQGRQIPFLGQHSARRDPASGRSIVDWRAFAIGRPLTFARHPGYAFADDAERAGTAALIREALGVYVYAFGQGPNDPGTIDIDLT